MKKLVTLLAAGAVWFAFTGCINEEQGEANNASSLTSAAKAAVNDDGEWGGPMGMGRMGGGHGLMLEALNLTEEQKEQIKEIMDTHRAQMQADGKCPMQGRRGQKADEETIAKMKESRTALMEKVAVILTEEQKALLEKTMSQVENGEIPQELIDARIAHMVEYLGLDETQKEQIANLMPQHMKAMHELKANCEAPESCMDSFIKLREEFQVTLAGILTEDQMAKMKELRPGKGNGMGNCIRKGPGKGRGNGKGMGRMGGRHM